MNRHVLFYLTKLYLGRQKNRCKYYDARVFISNIGRSMSQQLASESVHNLHSGAKYIYIPYYIYDIHMYVMCVSLRRHEVLVFNSVDTHMAYRWNLNRVAISLYFKLIIIYVFIYVLVRADIPT